MADEESPLIKALPPQSDYLTYLTIVEYNLNKESLPTLHHVLQDETLTTNIGWDLIHLLVPLLPESEQCLRDIARLGNPREVILKVTESLRLIEYDDDADAADEDANNAGESSAGAPTTATSHSKPTVASHLPSSEASSTLPANAAQFVALLSMLSILHPRIKTKYPSRFLSTTLQAILASFSSISTDREELVEAVVKTIKAVSDIRRPTLPSRKSSGMLSSKLAEETNSAADPEGTQGEDVASAEDTAIQLKLAQAFVTHMLEEYMLNLSDYEEIPGMAWCSRIMEKAHSGRTIPHTKTIADRFASEKTLQRRIDAIGQLVTLAQDLRITNEQLLLSAVAPEKASFEDLAEDEPPSSADEIPLSRLGSTLLFAARRVASVLYGSQITSTAPFDIFPDHHEILTYNLSSLELGVGQLGTEPPALIDAALALGLICLEEDAIGAPANDTKFAEYLQIAAFLSSNCPNPNLRGHAHYLTTSVLRSQPDDDVRLAFIRDTLEHCPFENLKVSAVGWIKGETIEANPPTQSDTASAEQTASVFSRPIALENLAPYIFPALREELLLPPVDEAWVAFQVNASFYLAGLNFLYLLLSAKHLHQKLAIADLYASAHVGTEFLPALLEASGRFGIELIEGGKLAEEKTDAVMAELQLLNDTVATVMKAAEGLEGS